MIIFFLVACASLPITVGKFDYCSLNCKRPVREHTMCGDTFPKGGGPACGAWKLGLSKADKKAILDKHNEARQKIASGQEQGYPTAADMRVMTWHGECATIAQRWMDQCTIADGTHDKCFATGDGSAGQNLFWATIADNDADAVARGVRLWYDEEAPRYVAAGYAVDKYQFAMDSGHFTQVAWALSSGLGCGLRKKAESAGISKYSLACNYFPAGNVMNGRMYKQGPPCSECPEGTACSSKYPALCGRPGDDDAEIDDGGDGSGGAATRLASALLIVHCLFLRTSIKYL